MFGMIVSAVIAACAAAGLLSAAAVRRRIPGQRMTGQLVFCSLLLAGAAVMFVWFYQWSALLASD